MGKKLIIRGADFSGVSISPTVISNEQTNTHPANGYYQSNGVWTNDANIKTVDMINVEGYESLFFQENQNNIEPSCIHCFGGSTGTEWLGIAPVNGGLNGKNAIGTTSFDLIDGTKNIAYAYYNNYAGFDIGLGSVISTYD